MQLQIDKASEIPDSSARDAAIKAIEKDFAGNADDYGRKLYLIENCLYGVDIQPIAIQISKLRFFISLICDQRTNRRKADNHGVRPLPNLETKFVAADTLISLKKDAQLELFESKKIQRLEKELQRIRHDHFATTTRQKKISLQQRDREIRAEMAKELEQTAFWDQDTAMKLAAWDPYDPQGSASFFEPLWMFDRSIGKGFDIVIGNPPYGANIDTMVDILKKLYPNTTKAFKDIYKLFIEAGILRLLRDNGHLCYITPNTLLRQPRYKDARSFLNGFRLLQVLDFGFGVFEQVVPTCVFLALKAKNNSSTVAYLDLSEQSRFSKDLRSETPEFVSQEKLLDLSHSDMSTMIIDGVAVYPLADVLDLKDAGINYQRVNVGLHDKGNSNLSSRLLYEGARESDSDVEYWKGVDIGKYQISDTTGRFVRVDTVNTLASNERVVLNRVYFSRSPKLIWRQTASHFVAAVDEVGIWFGRSIQAATLKPKFCNVDYYYVAALLNSSYIRYSYNRRVQETGRVFPQMKFANIKPLQLAVPSSLVQQRIASLAKEASARKKCNSNLSTKSVEREIDCLIYDVYRLTKELRAVVDEATQ